MPVVNAFTRMQGLFTHSPLLRLTPCKAIYLEILYCDGACELISFLAFDDQREDAAPCISLK